MIIHTEYTDGGDYPEVFFPVQASAGACADVERDARKNAGAPNEDDPQIAARWGIVTAQAMCMVREGRFDDAARVMAQWFKQFDQENGKS